MIIAIDGPAGAGKSTVATELARTLGFERLDTGALYRAVAYMGDRSGMEPSSLGLQDFVENIDLKIDDGRVLVAGEDVTSEIRSDYVSGLASAFAAQSTVRQGLLSLQRTVVADGDFVVDGRDIGSVIFPDAEVKIFLTASVEARAKRRFLEYQGQPDAPSLAEIRRGIELRDETDTNRKIAPLKKAQDAIVVDSSEMSLDMVVERCVALVRGKLG